MSMRQAMLASGLAVWLLELVLVLVLVIGGAQGKLVDLKPYHDMILKHHNDLRRTVSPQAADMRQIIWDDSLARDAEEWAEYCRYKRPRSYLYNSGSNLAYQRYHVNPRNPASIRSSLQQGLRIWSREREMFQYSQGCGRACAYAQMIYSSTHRVGCAMNTCSRLTVGQSREGYSTLFLCLYAPKGRLMQTAPYRKGRACSSCPSGTYCSQGLCAENGLMSSSAALTASRTVSLSAADGPVASLYGPAALSLPQSDKLEVAVSLSPRRSRQGSADKLSNGEVSYLLQVQNMFRAEARHPKLRWDTDLNRWTNWIISCDSDYPGPPHTFTNFYRISDSTPIYKVVDEWRNEGMDPNIQLEKGCRTPYDHTDCNHFTNMMEDSVTAVACSAKSCDDGTRQLVCLYSGPDERRQR